MDSEIQFLLGLVLNHKLPTPTKHAILARIGEVEKNLRSPAPSPPLSPMNMHATALTQGPPVQSPSMQKILDEMTHQQPPIPRPQSFMAQPPSQIPRDKETGRVQNITSVTSGGMVTGPSKVFR